ncbi:MAG: hypothetical protein ABUT20_29790 [Bacteroidota bacterium]
MQKKYSKQFILLLTCAAIFCRGQLSAQTLTTITVKAGEDLTGVYKQMYRFPQFTSGKVYFMNNDSAKGKLNYNMLMKKMQFIDKKGDTLFLSDNNPIRLVAIDTNIFYCNNGECVELLAGFAPAELAVSYRLKFADEQKIGAYGLPTSTQTIDNTKALTDNNYQLLLNKDLVFTKETQYYFIDAGKNFIAANKKNLPKLFPKQKDIIENYLKQNQVDFKNEKDLKNLFIFLSGPN